MHVVMRYPLHRLLANARLGTLTLNANNVNAIITQHNIFNKPAKTRLLQSN